MPRNPFLRRRSRLRWLWILPTAWVISRWLPREAPSYIDPTMEMVSAGQYVVQAVHDDGLLQLSAPSHAATENDEAKHSISRDQPGGPPHDSGRWVLFGLLGVEPVRVAESVMWLRQTLPAGTPVTVRFDRRRLDEQGRLAGYLYAQDKLMNAELLRTGWARCTAHASDVASIVRLMKQAEDEARSARLGSWKDD